MVPVLIFDPPAQVQRRLIFIVDRCKCVRRVRHRHLSSSRRDDELRRLRLRKVRCDDRRELDGLLLVLRRGSLSNDDGCVCMPGVSRGYVHDDQRSERMHHLQRRRAHLVQQPQEPAAQA